jgi:RNA polymerase sigma factor (sigma-70 family)
MQARRNSQRPSFRRVAVTSDADETPTAHVQNSERAFVDAVLAGDPDARARLVARMVCLPRFVRSLNRRVRMSQDDLDDLTQEAFRRFWSSLESFRCECSLEAWAFRVARSTTREARRSARAQRSHAVDPLQLCELADEDDGECAAAHTIGPEHDAVLRAFEALPADVRDLLHARAVERVPYAELAEALGTSAETLRKRYSRLLGELRDAATHGAAGREKRA